MRYLIKTFDKTLAEIEVPDEDNVLIYVERADDPNLHLAALQINHDGSVDAGHWPDGEEWVATLSTTGTRL